MQDFFHQQYGIMRYVRKWSHVESSIFVPCFAMLCFRLLRADQNSVSPVKACGGLFPSDSLSSNVLGSKLPIFPYNRWWSSTQVRRGLYTHYKDSLLKVGWVYPQYKEFRPWLKWFHDYLVVRVSLLSHKCPMFCRVIIITWCLLSRGGTWKQAYTPEN